MATETKINHLIALLEGSKTSHFQEIEYVLRHAPSIYQEFEATNEGRAAKMQAVMKVFYDDTPETDLIDLLADARHFCDARGMDFHRLDRMAHHHYTMENIGARTDEAHDRRSPGLRALRRNSVRRNGGQ